jgi:hypothetical protein
VSKHLTFVSDCAPAVIAIAVYRKKMLIVAQGDVWLRDDPPSFDFWRDRSCAGHRTRGTLRAFRNADRITTFKIFRRPGALRRRQLRSRRGHCGGCREKAQRCFGVCQCSGALTYGCKQRRSESGGASPHSKTAKLCKESHWITTNLQNQQSISYASPNTHSSRTENASRAGFHEFAETGFAED